MPRSPRPPAPIHYPDRWRLACYKGGAVVIHHREDPTPEGAITFLSARSKAEAQQLQVQWCRLSREDNKTYVRNEGPLHSLADLQAMVVRWVGRRADLRAMRAARAKAARAARS